MKHYFALLMTGVLLLAGCQSAEEDPEVENETETTQDITNDTNFIDAYSDFEGSKFENPVHLEILQELDVCTMTNQDSTLVASCIPENFNVMNVRKEGNDIKDFFALQIRIIS